VAFCWFSTRLRANPRNASTNRETAIALAVLQSFWQISKLLVLSSKNLSIQNNFNGRVKQIMKSWRTLF
jgi:hypothetical protein